MVIVVGMEDHYATFVRDAVQLELEMQGIQLHSYSLVYFYFSQMQNQQYAGKTGAKVKKIYLKGGQIFSLSQNRKNY